MNCEIGAFHSETQSCPGWVPRPAVHYLLHTEAGLSLRSVARRAGCHASTILRQVRRFENRRDDVLVDEALRRLGRTHFRMSPTDMTRNEQDMAAAFTKTGSPRDAHIEHETRKVLRRLNETGAVLAVAQELQKAVVVRALPGGKSVRTAVVGRDIARAMALKDWIICKRKGKIAQYVITSAGQAALKRFESQAGEVQPGFHDAPQAAFGNQHRIWGEKRVAPEEGHPERQVRYNVAESPLAVLARRKDRNGRPFLSDDLVAVGERLREDFELAQMGPRVTQNWEKFLTGPEQGGHDAGSRSVDGPSDARGRLSAALTALGPGLGDVALRCCCYLEGMEAAERRMGWSARSGKVVLKIALQRLKAHYEHTYGRHGPLIG